MRGCTRLSRTAGVDGQTKMVVRACIVAAGGCALGRGVEDMQQQEKRKGLAAYPRLLARRPSSWGLGDKWLLAGSGTLPDLLETGCFSRIMQCQQAVFHVVRMRTRRMRVRW